MKKQFIARSGTEGSVLRVLALGFLLLGVTACGGGGSSGNQNLSSASSINNVNNDGSVSSAASSANSSLPNTSDNGTQNPTTPPSNPPVDQPPINQPPVDPPMDQEPADQNPDTEPGSEDPESPPVDNPADETDEEAPSVWRPFNNDSPWNQPIPTDVSLHPESEELIAHMRASVKESTDFIWLNTREWSIPVYEVDSTQMSMVEVPVENINGASTGWYQEEEGVDRWDRFLAPIPDHAKPDSMTDAHMVILDRAQNKSWDFFGASKTSEGAWRCLVCTTTDLSDTGVRPLKNQSGAPWYRSHGARACGFPLLAGLIRPEEIAAGRIDHALYVGYPGIRSNIFTYPASTAQGTKGGRLNHCEGLPCGSRIQLDPDLDLDALGLTREAKIIAKALQTYGAFVGDYAGESVLLNVQNDPQALVDFGSAMVGGLLSAISLEHFRVVQWGTEFVDQEITAACPVTADEQAPEIEEPELEDFGFEVVDCSSSMFSGVSDTAFGAATTNSAANSGCASVQVGEDRRYLIYDLPAGYDPTRPQPYPVVFAWHGCWSNAGQMRYGAQITQRSSVPVISIYPHSRRGDGNGGFITDNSGDCWIMLGQSAPLGSHLPFFDAAVGAIGSHFHADRNRILTSGYSSGSAMSHYLGCERGDVIKGVVGIAGWQDPTLNCSSAVPALVAHGAQDPTVPVSGFYALIDKYAERNACSTDSVSFSPAGAPANPDRSCSASICSGPSLAYCVSDCPITDSSDPDYASCRDRSAHDFGTWWWFIDYGVEILLNN